MNYSLFLSSLLFGFGLGIIFFRRTFIGILIGQYVSSMGLVLLLCSLIFGSPKSTLDAKVFVAAFIMMQALTAVVGTSVLFARARAGLSLYESNSSLLRESDE